MGGLFGCTAQNDCLNDLFYGTDYHSHLGTKRGGLAVLNSKDFSRSIHNIENDYFRSKFEPDLPKLHGHKGIGIISDYDPQPLIIGSHLGTFSIATVSKINNIESLAAKALHSKRHFSEMSGGETSPTELVAMLISEAESFEAGIQYAQEAIKGSCSLLLLSAVVRPSSPASFFGTSKMTSACSSWARSRSFSRRSRASSAAAGAWAGRPRFFDARPCSCPRVCCARHFDR